MVKQLPAWRSLPARAVATWERVVAAKRRFQNSAYFLRDYQIDSSSSRGKDESEMTNGNGQPHPVIPPICHVVAHVQEMESKGFIIVASPGQNLLLASGPNGGGAEQQKFSWKEFQELANVVDQIRQCRRTEFQLLDVDDAQAEALKQRILKMSDQDIVSLIQNVQQF